MDTVVLQTSPTGFRVLSGDGAPREVVLEHHTRRGLRVAGIPALTVAEAIVGFLTERGALPTGPGPVDLGAAAGGFPEFVEDVRSRLS